MTAGVFATDGVPILTGGQASAFDREAIDVLGVPESALMESAGRCAADLADWLAPRGPILVFAGRGNNGGDAVVAARTLRARGRDVRLVVVAERPPDDPLLHGWPPSALGMDGPPVDPAEATGLVRASSLVIDGILGTGLRGEPREDAARWIRALEGAARVLALDVPSGVQADDGAVPGEAVRADVTVAFGWPKLGCLLEPGRSRGGRLVAAEIGFPPLVADAVQARLLTPGWAARVRPRRAPATHKNRVGAVLVLGGHSGMAGAPVLAARASLRSGAGFVRIASTGDNREVVQTAVPDAPFLPLEDATALEAALAASHAVVVGPGLGTGPAAERALAAVLAAPLPVVIDADGLNLLAEGRPRGVTDLAGPAPRVLTPHPGEMARLAGADVAAVEADRPAAARALAERSGAWVVLKGTPTLVAGPGAPLGISGLASSDLAVAGMGDVLAGSVGAFLAQGVAAGDAAGLALLAGAAAAAATGLGPGLAASDVPEALPEALAALDAGGTDLPFPWVTLDLPAPR